MPILIISTCFVLVNLTVSLYINIFGIFTARITWSMDYHTGSNLFLSRCFQDIGYGLKLHDDY